jgi:hypothetical protein
LLLLLSLLTLFNSKDSTMVDPAVAFTVALHEDELYAIGSWHVSFLFPKRRKLPRSRILAATPTVTTDSSSNKNNSNNIHDILNMPKEEGCVEEEGRVEEDQLERSSGLADNRRNNNNNDVPPVLEMSESKSDVNQVVVYMPKTHPELTVQEFAWGFAKQGLTAQQFDQMTNFRHSPFGLVEQEHE